MPKLATKTISSGIDVLERKIRGRGDVRAEIGFTLYISNEYMNDIIKIVESNSNWCCDWKSKTRNKKTRRLISWRWDGTYACFIDNLPSIKDRTYVINLDDK